MARRRRLERRRRNRRAALAAVVLLLATGLGFVYWIFAGSLPRLEGRLRLAGLEGPVEIERDAAGVPVLRAGDRVDLAQALGFLHGQERFFQMDLLRRAGAGELSALVGARALDIDMKRRRHRFRSRAEAILAGMAPDQRALLDAYVAGVNQGLAALGHTPFEYTLLWETPVPWQEADTLLVVYALYFELQDSDDQAESTRAQIREALGPSLAEFLYPPGNPYEAPIDGIMLPEPPLPRAGPEPTPEDSRPPADPPPPVKGSNAFAVAGTLTATGAAIVANDQHLELRMPNIWYRARLIQTGPGDSGLDIAGTTLPGLPYVIAGSNTHVAWGFTNGYIATGDAVLLEPSPDNPDEYSTPQGKLPLQVVVDRVCVAREACRDLTIEETVWGPVVGRDSAGRRIVWHWLAQDADAIDLTGETELEQARTVRQALDAVHHLGLPDQNILVGDRDGHIAWTIAGKVPRRIGLGDGLPHSWADGTHGWQGDLAPDEIPEIVDPPDGRLWSANNRVVGGDALARLGDGGYDQGNRARQIRDDLRARDRFAEADLLAIQLDDRALALVPWQNLLMSALGEERNAAPRFARMLPYVRDWGGRAEPESVGYRLVRGYESLAVNLLYRAYLAPIAGGEDAPAPIPHSGTRVAERLLTERPANLVPKPYGGWDEVEAAVLDQLARAVQDGAGGDLARFTWGRRNHAGIHHPFGGAIPLFGRLLDPPDDPMAGDEMMPLVIKPGFGASERFVVSPGHEAGGIYEMPGGQAGDPLSPYYLAGHEDWVLGRPSAFLPGAARWRLVLEPG
jgi:penicillin amidase